MVVRHPAGEVVQVARAGTPTGDYDEQGNPILTADSSFTIIDVAVAPQGSEETTDAPGIFVITGYELYCPPGTVLLPTDRLTVRSVDGWQVQGDSTAAAWRSPFDGGERGVVVSVKRAS